MHLSKYVSIKFRLYMIYYVNVIKFTKERQISSSTGIVTCALTHDFHVLIKFNLIIFDICSVFVASKMYLFISVNGAYL